MDKSYVASIETDSNALTSRRSFFAQGGLFRWAR